MIEFAVCAMTFVVGDQTTESVAAKPESVKVVELPWQIVTLPEPVTVGNGST